jgi:hypothetical protein
MNLDTPKHSECTGCRAVRMLDGIASLWCCVRNREGAVLCVCHRLCLMYSKGQYGLHSWCVCVCLRVRACTNLFLPPSVIFNPSVQNTSNEIDNLKLCSELRSQFHRFVKMHLVLLTRLYTAVNCNTGTIHTHLSTSSPP